jgi:hypothetical protein
MLMQKPKPMQKELKLGADAKRKLAADAKPQTLMRKLNEADAKANWLQMQPADADAKAKADGRLITSKYQSEG